LKKMSVHNFSSQLITNDMRKVVNKEIWKWAMKEVKKLKSSIQAKIPKQFFLSFLLH
jgi:hypothetical protein